ncbi:MAG: ABC transporter substrate-binding protein [Bacillota bacterium]|jgi:polar amino acid transport system substrate-binding protein
MKRSNQFLLMILVLCLAIFMLTGCGGNENDLNKATGDEDTATAELPTLVAGADITYPPFEYMEGSTAVGFDIDLWQEIGKRMGRKTEHANYAWDGLIPALQAKKFDVIMSCMGITEERLEQIDFSMPYFLSSFGLAVTKTSNIKSLEDCKGRVVGVQTGTMAEKWTRDNKEALGIKEIIPYEIMNDGILDLEAGRIDAVFNDKPYLGYTLKDNKNVIFLSDISFGDGIEVGIGITKDNTELKAQIDQAIKDIIEDNTYHQIYEKWFGYPPAEKDIPKF